MAELLRSLGRIAALVLLAISLLAGAVSAQDAAEPDYPTWERVADRAERALEDARASNGAFEDLRAEVVSWREQFLGARDANRARIATLQSQIDALGTPPEDGSEPSEIGARRKALEEQLARLRAPGLKAEEAYNRSDGIIREIDNTLRLRQADKLLTLGPSPVNPVNWPAAGEALLSVPVRMTDETRAALASDARRTEFQDNLPVVIGLLVMAIVLLWNGRTCVERIVAEFRRRSVAGSAVWSFMLSVGMILLPLVGLILLTRALVQTGLLGEHSTVLIGLLPLWGGVALGARWLASRLFLPPEGRPIVPMTEEAGPSALRTATWLGVLMAIGAITVKLGDLYRFEDEARAVIEFPVLVLAGLLLFRMGRLLVAGPLGPGEGEQGFRMAAFRLLGRASMAVAVIGPLLAAVGYAEAARALLFPAALTLALLGLVLVLQRFAADLFRLVARQGEDEDGLIPVLIGFALVVLSMPFLALIWGARTAELTEIWTRFQEGFTLGGTRISPTDFLTFVAIFAVGYTLTRLLQSALRTTILPKTRIDVGGQTAIISGLGYVGIFLAALFAISSTGIDLSSLAIVAGALSVGIGFGLQNIVSNFVSGIILLIERPIAEGDWIEVGGQMGYVRKVSVRSTRIETFDRTDVIVPNADLVSGVVTNWTRGNTMGRIIVPVGVAYGTDTRKVEKILLEIARAHPAVTDFPPPKVVLIAFGADSLDFEIRAILYDVNLSLDTKSDMNHEIVRRFAEAGIEIPFAQRDIWLRNPEVLRPTPETGDDTA